MNLEERVAELEAYRKEHDAEHENLRRRMYDELQAKWRGDLEAQSRHLDGKLKAQDEQLGVIRGETEQQTPLLKKIRRGQRASDKERDRRVALEKAAADLAAKAADDRKKADEAFDRKRNRVLLGLAVLAGIGTAYATFFRH